ncbi:hypothetical protein HN873_009375, partial [Arachis hypogaea]
EAELKASTFSVAASRWPPRRRGAARVFLCATAPHASSSNCGSMPPSSLLGWFQTCVLYYGAAKFTMATKSLAFSVTVSDLSKSFGSELLLSTSKVRVFTLRCSAVTTPIPVSSWAPQQSFKGERPWKTLDARLVLEDGSIWKAKSFGATGTQAGEVGFNTSLTGYQEILTDPSYADQFVLMTNPHISNTGVNFGEYSYYWSL